MNDQLIYCMNRVKDGTAKFNRTNPTSNQHKPAMNDCLR